jgi:hypothetical protein
MALTATHGKAFLVLALFAALCSCNSPASPERSPTSTPRYAFGLYENFEKDAVDSMLWSFPDLRGVEIREESSGNRYLEVIDNVLAMKNPSDPVQIRPEDFDRMSGRLRIPSDAEYKESIGSGPYMEYDMGGGTPSLEWRAKIGIRRVSSNSARIFGGWDEFWSGGKWESLVEAEFDRWYTLEMQILVISPAEFKLLFKVDGRVFAETVPPDGALLLDRSRELGSSRFIRTAEKDKGTFAGWFDDIRAVIVRPGEGLDTLFGNESPSSFEFLGVPSASGRAARGPGPAPDVKRGEGRKSH